MTVQADIRARLRTLLDDTGAGIWSDGELNTHIDEGARLLSHHLPREMSTLTATTPGSRAISIVTLSDRIRVRAVEYKTGAFPETWTPFRVWGDTLTILGPSVPDGANALIYWEALHQVLVASSTLPTDHDSILLRASAALACEQQQADTANSINTGGAFAPRDWQTLASQHWAAYHSQVNRRLGVRLGNLYQPADPVSTQQTDPGP